MELTEKLLSELQKRLKVGNRRGVHLNAIPANSRYKFDINRLSHIDKNLPDNFVKALLSELPLKFRISWKNNVSDLNSLYEEDQLQLVRITKAFENLINQTEAIESEKGINTFGFGFPILARRDRADNKLTVAPILIWSLRIKRTNEFNTWEILRNEEDPIYINEVLINHLQSDANIQIDQIPSEMLDDGLIDKNELIEICSKLIRAINTSSPDDLEETFNKKLDKITSIGDKVRYEKLPLNFSNSTIDFGGLFSIFEVQKQNIINDYSNLMELKGISIDLGDLEGHSFQPISSVETDPSQQSILHSLEATRNILIQGPPGTGKSQTLTAVLINALENNKKTIVVCEKRTALEVLHNALIEKGLNYHCVLVRDIVKDRKTVVDSVRDRVDNTEYKRYRLNYSKESLDNLILKVKGLITNINKKHQKLDEKLIGIKGWSDVVGNFLAEIKRSTDDNSFYIEKNLFNYTTQELNTLLDLIQKGQKLYSEFLPIESTSFINSLKFVDDNPYIIEQNINEDFDFYTKQLELIKLLLEANKSEFIALRESELKNQIALIDDCIEKIITKENELDALVSTTKADFCNFRKIELESKLKSIDFQIEQILIKNAEFPQLLSSTRNDYCTFRGVELNQQIAILSEIIGSIETIISNNKNNSNLTDEVKVNSLRFKILAVLSKQKKQTITEQSKLKTNFKRLQEAIEISKDFPSFDFGTDLNSKLSNLNTFKKSIDRTKNDFNNKSLKEFESFNLSTILEINDISMAFKAIESVIQNSEEDKDLQDMLKSIQSAFKNFLQDISLNFQLLSKYLAKSKDINLCYSLSDSTNKNITVLSEVKEKLDNIENSFSDKIENEFTLFNLNSVLNTNNIDKCFHPIQSIINDVNISEALKTMLQSIQFNFKTYLSDITSIFEALSKELAESKDIKLNYTFNKTYPENKKGIHQLKAKIDLIENEFDSKIQSEFEQINLLKANPNEIDIKSLPILQEKINTLVDKIKNDKWTIESIKFTEFYKLISDIEKLICNKTNYFNSERDLFTIEFKWFCYKLIFRCLK